MVCSLASQMTSMPLSQMGLSEILALCLVGLGGMRGRMLLQHCTAAFSVVKHHQRAEGCSPPPLIPTITLDLQDGLRDSATLGGLLGKEAQDWSVLCDARPARISWGGTIPFRFGESPQGQLS